jgi:hypothetical protein
MAGPLHDLPRGEFPGGTVEDPTAGHEIGFERRGFTGQLRRAARFLENGANGAARQQVRGHADEGDCAQCGHPSIGGEGIDGAAFPAINASQAHERAGLDGGVRRTGELLVPRQRTIWRILELELFGLGEAARIGLRHRGRNRQPEDSPGRTSVHTLGGHGKSHRAFGDRAVGIRERPIERANHCVGGRLTAFEVPLCGEGTVLIEQPRAQPYEGQGRRNEDRQKQGGQGTRVDSPQPSGPHGYPS